MSTKPYLYSDFGLKSKVLSDSKPEVHYLRLFSGFSGFLRLLCLPGGRQKQQRLSTQTSHHSPPARAQAALPTWPGSTTPPQQPHGARRFLLEHQQRSIIESLAAWGDSSPHQGPPPSRGSVLVPQAAGQVSTARHLNEEAS